MNQCECCHKMIAKTRSWKDKKVVPDYEPRLWIRICDICLKAKMGAKRYKKEILKIKTNWIGGIVENR